MSVSEQELELRRRKARADHAESILNDGLVTAAFKDIQESLAASILGSALDQTQQREDAYRCLRLLARLRDGFEAHIRDGVLADHKLAELKEKKAYEFNTYQDAMKRWR